MGVNRATTPVETTSSDRREQEVKNAPGRFSRLSTILGQANDRSPRHVCWYLVRLPVSTTRSGVSPNAPLRAHPLSRHRSRAYVRVHARSSYSRRRRCASIRAHRSSRERAAASAPSFTGDQLACQPAGRRTAV